jgi:hypothetical protein
MMLVSTTRLKAESPAIPEQVENFRIMFREGRSLPTIRVRHRSPWFRIPDCTGASLLAAAKLEKIKAIDCEW